MKKLLLLLLIAVVGAGIAFGANAVFFSPSSDELPAIEPRGLVDEIASDDVTDDSTPAPSALKPTPEPVGCRRADLERRAAADPVPHRSRPPPTTGAPASRGPRPTSKADRSRRRSSSRASSTSRTRRTTPATSRRASASSGSARTRPTARKTSASRRQDEDDSTAATTDRSRQRAAKRFP